MVNPKPNDRAYRWYCDAQNLYDNIKRLNLDVEKFIPIHGRVDTWEHFLAHLGKPPKKAGKDQKAGN